MKTTKKVQHIHSKKGTLFASSISAGFPNPADDLVEGVLDLNELIIMHPQATYFLRVEGNSMIEVGIYPGDIVAVDRSLEPRDNSIVIAALNGEFTIKRLKKKGKRVYLIPENKKLSPIPVTDQDQFEVFGVVTYCLHKLNGN